MFVPLVNGLRKRKQELTYFCDKYRSKNKFDAIVPVSGGKDSSMVAHKLKHEYNMHPLCVNISLHVDANTEINEINLNNFMKHGFDTIRMYPNQQILKKLDKIGLLEQGRPCFGWTLALVVAPIKIAMAFGIPFIMYGEEGETEYGGSTKLKNSPVYSMQDTIDFYLSGINPTNYLNEFNEKELYWWLPPSKKEIEDFQPSVAHWSYFENWNSYNNYKYSKKHLGLKELSDNSIGTYNKFAQTDSILYPLHTYLMYLKFGFGRCSQDVCIDIRNGRISREEGIDLINKYDEVYPEIFEQDYLDYYQLTKAEFYKILDKFANKDLLKKVDERWVKRFTLV